MSKNIWWPMIGALVVVVALVALGLTITQPTVNPTSRSVSVDKKTIQQDNGLTKLDIEYPYINGVPQAVNDEIKKILDDQITSFKKISNENEQARIATNKDLPVDIQQPAQPAPGQSWYNLYIRYQQGVVDTKTVSIVFFLDEYTGGAHGNKIFIPFNYDIVRAQLITLADAFSAQPNYLSYVSDAVYAGVVQQMKDRGVNNPDVGWIKTGTAPVIDNFSSFIITTDDRVTIFIPPYQVAAYAMGEFDITIPVIREN